MLEKHGLLVTHAPSVEDALALLDQAVHEGRAPGWDVVLTDVYLKGELSGKDLLLKLRRDYHYAKGQLPVLVMTGDANPANKSDLLRAGANDLVQKPIEERLLRSEEHTSELQSLMRNSYAVFCLKKKT